jgi:two-component system OmpR family response regulator
VLVSRLRHKLEQEPKSPALIRTIRNTGYIFSSAVMRG